MSAAPVPLRVVDPPAADADMVEMLEGYLTMAKAGQLNFLGVVVTFKDAGAVGSGWVKRESAHRFTVLGAFEAMKWEFNEKVAQL